MTSVLTARRRSLLAWAGLALVAASWIGWALQPAPRQLDSSRVERGAIALERVDQGIARVRELYRIDAAVAGELERITLEAGDPVTAGDTLARLRPLASTPLDPRSRQQAEAALAVAQAQQNQAEAAQTSADDFLRRAESLFGRQLIAERELTQAKAVAREARARVDAAIAARRQAEALLASSAEPSDGVLSLRAPISGVVLRRFREHAGPVAAGTPLLELGDPADLEIEAEFLSQEAATVTAGAQAQIEAWGGSPIAATVRRVEPLGELKVSALGVEERRVRILLDPAEIPAGLGHGYQVDVRIEIEARAAALTLPLEALVRRGEGWQVWAVIAGRARARAVEVGLSDGRRREIISGVEEGETVLLYPPNDLAEGEAVEVTP